MSAIITFRQSKQTSFPPQHDDVVVRYASLRNYWPMHARIRTLYRYARTCIASCTRTCARDCEIFKTIGLRYIRVVWSFRCLGEGSRIYSNAAFILFVIVFRSSRDKSRLAGGRRYRRPLISKTLSQRRCRGHFKQSK